MQAIMRLIQAEQEKAFTVGQHGESFRSKFIARLWSTLATLRVLVPILLRVMLLMVKLLRSHRLFLSNLRLQPS